MDSQQSEVAYEVLPFLRAYKDGRIERLLATETVPPSFDPHTNVASKDVFLITNSTIPTRLYLPKILHTPQKLPLLVYFHGGAFCVGSPATPIYHNLLSTLVSRANVVAVSVGYRLVPEHHLPVAYQDSWDALKWVFSHSDGGGSETWLNKFVDFDKVFLAGDSAGGNITHNMAMLAGDPKVGLGVRILGIVLVHPHFWGCVSIGSEADDPVEKHRLDILWPFLCPSSPDNDDHRLNPVGDGAPSLSGLGCKRVLVFVTERDSFRDRGWVYYETLGKCGWKGVAEISETEGEDHVFHLFIPACEKANELINRFAAFLNLSCPES